MADKHWVCTDATGDWSASANWSATRSGAGGAGAPGANDDVFVEIGTQPLMNLAGITADLGSFTWSADYPLGTSSTPISITVSGTSAYTTPVNRSGVCRISKATSVRLQAAGTAGIDKLSIECPSNATVDLSVTSTGGFAANSGDYIHISAGTVTIDGEAAAAAGTTVRCLGGLTTFNSDSNALRKLVAASGSRVVSKRSIVDIVCDGGAHSQTDGAAAITGTLEVSNGGYHNHTASGTIATSDVRPGGKADDANNKYNWTLTNRTKWKGGTNFDTSTRLLANPTTTPAGEVGPG